MKSSYDVVIIGSGHNGLIAGAYLTQAGLSVLVLEKRAIVGGATLSEEVFPGMAVRPSVYSYLVSLLPRKIIQDLGLEFNVARRSVAAYAPYIQAGQHKGLIMSNEDEALTRSSFFELTGSDKEYEDYLYFLSLQRVLAEKIWPTVLEPLLSREEMQSRFITPEEKKAWNLFIEEPLDHAFSELLSNDIVRGLVFTDAKIGMLTSPTDPTLLQNKTFLYHVIGQGTGEWGVPIGGMGNLVKCLTEKIIKEGGKIKTKSTVTKLETDDTGVLIRYSDSEGEKEVRGQCALVNMPGTELEKILTRYTVPKTVTGSVFKINMLVKKLPALRSGIDPRKAFAGTFRIDEGYELMKETSVQASKGKIPTPLPGEMYCHTLTDPSILSSELEQKGYHTLTYFGLDTPYELFTNHPERKQKILELFFKGINQYLAEPLEECLATDIHNDLCIEAKTPVDLEKELGMPRGNIFHGTLDWPFAETEEEIGKRGVETLFPNIYIAGSSAKRGGAVSGIPGYHSAQLILERLKNS